MADIIKINLTDVQDTLQGTYQMGFELTDYENSTTLELAAGRVEEIGGSQFRVESGDLAITDPGVTLEQMSYVLIKDDGDGTASAYLSSKPGPNLTDLQATWDSNKGGHYINDASADDGAKVVFQVYSTAGASKYLYKGRLLNPNMTDIVVNNNITSTNHIIGGNKVISTNSMDCGSNIEIGGKIGSHTYIKYETSISLANTTEDAIYDAIRAITAGDPIMVSGAIYEPGAGVTIIVSRAIILSGETYTFYGLNASTGAHVTVPIRNGITASSAWNIDITT